MEKLFQEKILKCQKVKKIMEEEKYRILSDLMKISHILNKIRLQDGRVRNKLARLLFDEHVFMHKTGERFIHSLLKNTHYNNRNYQQAVLHDSMLYADILQHCVTDSIEKIAEWQQKISENKEKLFYTWMRESAVSDISKYLEAAKRNLYEKANENQNHDLAVIRAFSSRFVFDCQEDADRLYELLLQYEGRIFRSWIGLHFTEEIQKGTTKYKISVRKRRSR